MKTALVTGATSGIGHEIAKKLLEMGYVVYGLGRDFSKISINNDNFIALVCDFTKMTDLKNTLSSLKKVDFNLIVNSAGLAFFGQLEDMSTSNIETMIAVNLQAPLIISQYFLRTLKKNKGIIINISSVTAQKESPLACVYSATKAGLSHFSKSLFEETRKTGLKVVSIYADMTKTNFYDNNTYFECDDDETSFIKPEDVARSVEFILEQGENLVLSELTIKPQKHKIKKKSKI